MSNESVTSYTDIFMQALPYYLSIGMTPEQYWEGSPYLKKAYRDAHAYRLQEQNTIAWINGIYIARAVAVNLSKDAEYPKEPLEELVPKTELQTSKERKSRYDKVDDAMEIWAKSFNF